MEHSLDDRNHVDDLMMCPPAAKRSPLFPDVSMAAEVGVANFEVSSWHGFVVPANTPRPIVNTLNKDLNRMLGEDEVKKAFAAQGVTPDGGTPTQFPSFIDGQKSLWKRVVKDRNITVD